MTITQASGTRIFISNDPLPENPTADDFKALVWVEVGEITQMKSVAIKTDKFMCFGDIREISNSLPINPIY